MKIIVIINAGRWFSLSMIWIFFGVDLFIKYLIKKLKKENDKKTHGF